MSKSSNAAAGGGAYFLGFLGQLFISSQLQKALVTERSVF